MEKQTGEETAQTDEHDHLGQKLDECLRAYGARWLRSYLSTDRRRLACEFEAADSEAVRTSYRSARVGFDCVWSAELYARGEKATDATA